MTRRDQPAPLPFKFAEPTADWVARVRKEREGKTLSPTEVLAAELDNYLSAKRPQAKSILVATAIQTEADTVKLIYPILRSNWQAPLDPIHTSAISIFGESAIHENTVAGGQLFRELDTCVQGHTQILEFQASDEQILQLAQAIRALDPHAQPIPPRQHGAAR